MDSEMPEDRFRPQDRDPAAEAIPDLLERALSRDLPGEAAHRKAIPAGYTRGSIAKGAASSEASVLLALHPGDAPGQIFFPLILRPAQMLLHAGQVSLPGGARNAGETPIECALREAWEEVGLRPETVRVLGRLTPITIPVSSYRVEIVVGWTPVRPAYSLHEREVLKIVLGDPARLVEEGPSDWVETSGPGGTWRHPAYLVEGEKVWGATALIVAEFLEVWRGLRGSR